MSSKQIQRIETYAGECRLGLSNGPARLRCVLRVWQHLVGATPTLREAEGGLKDLPHGDAAFAMMERKPLELELEDGRKWSVFITDLQGSFTGRPL